MPVLQLASPPTSVAVPPSTAPAARGDGRTLLDTGGDAVGGVQEQPTGVRDSGIDVPDRSPRPAIASAGALIGSASHDTEPAPVEVHVDGIDVTAPVHGVGVDARSGQLAIPGDADSVVWYEHGPTPGAPGSAVLAGHVDYGGRRGVFFRLSEVGPGSIVTVDYDDGSTRDFVVVDNRHHAKSNLPTDELFRREGEPVVVLLTCGGEFDAGARSYLDNVVVTAVPVPASDGPD